MSGLVLVMVNLKSRKLAGLITLLLFQYIYILRFRIEWNGYVCIQFRSQ